VQYATLLSTLTTGRCALYQAVNLHPRLAIHHFAAASISEAREATLMFLPSKTDASKVSNINDIFVWSLQITIYRSATLINMIDLSKCRHEFGMFCVVAWLVDDGSAFVGEFF
jgi:hypothetical protein